MCARRARHGGARAISGARGSGRMTDASGGHICGIKMGSRAPPWFYRCEARVGSLYPARDAPVAQLDRALPSEGRGQRFESSQVRHFSRQMLALSRTRGQTLFDRARPVTVSHLKRLLGHEGAGVWGAPVSARMGVPPRQGGCPGRRRGGALRRLPIWRMLSRSSAAPWLGPEFAASNRGRPTCRRWFPSWCCRSRSRSLRSSAAGLRGAWAVASLAHATAKAYFLHVSKKADWC